jgi:hypothetical protein
MMDSQKPRSRLILTIVTGDKIETILVPEAENVYFDMDAHYDEIQLRDYARLQPLGETFSLKFDPIPDEKGVKYIVASAGEETTEKVTNEKVCDKCGHAYHYHHDEYRRSASSTACSHARCTCDGWFYNIMKDVRETDQKGFTLHYEYVARPGTDGPHSVRYFYRCILCKRELEEIQFAAHATIEHGTRDYVIDEIVTNEVDFQPKPRIVAKFDYLPKRVFSKKPQRVRCSLDGQVIFHSEIRDHMEEEHPTVMDYIELTN